MLTEPSTVTGKGSQVWTNRLYLLVGGLFLFRLCFLLLTNSGYSLEELTILSVSSDGPEAFTSQPTLLFLCDALATLNLDSVLVLRLLAASLGTFALLIIFKFARILYDARVAFLAVAALSLTPGNALLNYHFTIHGLLFFFWSGALLALWKLAERHKNRQRWELVLVLLLCVGCLTDLHMAAFIPLAWIYFYSNPETRPLLRRIDLHVKLLPVLACLSYAVWTFYDTTAGDAPARTEDMAGMGKHLLDFIYLQAMTVSPLLYVLVTGLLITTLACLRRLPAQERFLWIFSAPALLFTLVFNLRQSVSVDTTVIYSITAIILLSGWACNKFSTGRLYPWRKAFIPGIWIGLLLMITTYLNLSGK